jgi:hypothetical protein
MKIIEGLTNALEFFEALGYKSGGDIHDDLERAIKTLQTKFPNVSKTEIMTSDAPEAKVEPITDEA